MKTLLLLLALAAGLLAQPIAGTYTGNLKVETPQGARETVFTIKITQDGEKISAAIAPATEEPVEATKVEKTADGLHIEALPPGAQTPIAFDVIVKDNKMTGTVKVAPGVAGTVDLTKK